MTPAEQELPAEEFSVPGGSRDAIGLFEYSPFRQVLEAIPVGLFVLGSSGAPVYANSQAMAILRRGVSPDATPDTLAATYSAYVAGTNDLYPAERMPIIRALAGESTSVDDMALHDGDEVIYLEVSAAPVRNAAGSVIYAVAVFRDITPHRAIERALQRLADELAERVRERSDQLEDAKRALAEAEGAQPAGAPGQPARAHDGSSHEVCANCTIPNELERAQQNAALAREALSLFLANFSHELRTPLNHIIGFSDLIESKIERGIVHGIGQHAVNIKKSGASLLDTLNKIITVAESQSSSAHPTVEIFELAPLLFEIVERFEPLAIRNGNRFELAIEGELGPVSSDSSRVRVAIEQIVGNACKHCRDGEISVTASRAGSTTEATIRIVVRDSGRGIDPVLAGRLLRGELVPGDPLHAAGLGLGIPLAAQSLEAIGGSLRHLGDARPGSTFEIEFPVSIRA